MRDDNKTWKACLYVEVIDNFGLDDNDIKKFQSNLLVGRSFAAWYILQQRKGFRPFQTKIKMMYCIEGNIENCE